MASYVITSWKVSPNPDESKVYIDIKGRAPGLISWLLTRIGIEPTVAVRVTDREFRLETGSLGGRFVRSVPINKITSVIHGYSKPWKAALLLIVLAGLVLPVFVALVAGIVAAVVVGLLGVAWGVVYYYLDKRFVLGVHAGGQTTGLHFKRSVIENHRLDQKDAEEAGRLITALLRAKN